MTTRRVQPFVATALAAILVAACGGGGGNEEKTEKTSTTAPASTTSSAPAPLDLTAFVGRWFGAPVDLLVAEDGSGMLVFPELAADGSDVVAMTFVISEVTGSAASAEVQSNPGNTLFTPGQQITLTVQSDTELVVDPDGGVFCRPDRSCIPPFE